MDKKEILAAAKELVLAKPVAYLTTIDEDGYPYTTAVFNLRNRERYPDSSKVLEEYDNDYTTIYVSTNTSSVKVKNITKNNKVAMYYSIPEVFKGMYFKGTAEFLDDQEFKKNLWMDRWKMYYPLGPTDPDFTILKITTEYISSWYNSGKHVLRFEEK